MVTKEDLEKKEDELRGLEFDLNSALRVASDVNVDVNRRRKLRKEALELKKRIETANREIQTLYHEYANSRMSLRDYERKRKAESQEEREQQLNDEIAMLGGRTARENAENYVFQNPQNDEISRLSERTAKKIEAEEKKTEKTAEKEKTAVKVASVVQPEIAPVAGAANAKIEEQTRGQEQKIERKLEKEQSKREDEIKKRYERMPEPPRAQGENFKPYGGKQMFYEEKPHARPGSGGMFVPEALVLLALAIHIVDYGAFGFEVQPGTIFIRLGMYAILSWFIHMAFKHTLAQTFLKEQGPLMAFTILGVTGLKYLVQWMGASEDIIKMLTGIVLAIPIWTLYLTNYKGLNYPFFEKGFWTGIARVLYRPIQATKVWYIFIGYLMVSSLIAYSSSYIIEQGVTTQGYNRQAGIEFITNEVGKAWTSTTTLVTGIINGGRFAYNRYLNETLGYEYTGQVEQNRARTGVFMERIKPQSKLYENVDVTFTSLISVRYFQNDLNMTVTCEAEGKNKTRIPGTVEPQNLQLFREDKVVVFCRFQAGTLTPGSYKVSMYADFNFSTWAYTTYVFMDRSMIAAAIARDENINSKFSIPEKPEVIYTSGPISLGMNEELTMPIGLSSDTPTRVPIGMTLKNANGQSGDIIDVNRFEIRAPEYFNMDNRDCSAPLDGAPSNDNGPVKVEGYRVFAFKDAQPDLDQSMLSVGCNMHISPEDSMKMLRSTGGRTRVTLVGTADYHYRLKQSTTVSVIDTP